MKKILKEYWGRKNEKVFFKIAKDTGLKYILVFILLIFIKYIDKTDLTKQTEFFSLNLYEGIISIVSLLYLFNYRPRDRKIQLISERMRYKSGISFIREIIWSIFLFLLGNIIVSLFTEDKNIHIYFNLMVLIRFYFSEMMLITGMSFFGFLIVIILASVGVYTIGVFDLRWWALITGMLSIWNYVNSIEFVILLRKGKNLSIENIPNKVHYMWQRNKILGYILSVLLFASLLIADSLENACIVSLDQINLRILTFAVLSTFVAVLYLISVSFLRPQKKTINTIIDIIKLPKWKKYIAQHLVLQRKSK